VNGRINSFLTAHQHTRGHLCRSNVSSC